MEIGTDILYIPRLKKIINENKNFIHKILTEKEIEIAKKHKDPIYFYATRFAGKEAIIKATNGEFDFREIEILKEESGKPKAYIINNNSICINLSLSFDNDYAIAFCIVQKK